MLPWLDRTRIVARFQRDVDRGACRLEHKKEGVVADPDFVAIPQLGATANRLTVDLRPIATAQVFDQKITAVFDDLSVLAADGSVIEYDLT
jgi:hypothetical protein